MQEAPPARTDPKRAIFVRIQAQDRFLTIALLQELLRLQVKDQASFREGPYDQAVILGHEQGHGQFGGKHIGIVRKPIFQVRDDIISRRSPACPEPDQTGTINPQIPAVIPLIPADGKHVAEPFVRRKDTPDPPLRQDIDSRPLFSDQDIISEARRHCVDLVASQAVALSQPFTDRPVRLQPEQSASFRGDQDPPVRCFMERRNLAHLVSENVAVHDTAHPFLPSDHGQQSAAVDTRPKDVLHAIQEAADVFPVQGIDLPHLSRLQVDLDGLYPAQGHGCERRTRFPGSGGE